MQAVSLLISLGQIINGQQIFRNFDIMTVGRHMLQISIVLNLQRFVEPPPAEQLHANPIHNA